MIENTNDWWKALASPFHLEDYEWRLAQCGKTSSGKFWGIALCYVTNRAIMNRLDDVCGPANWKNEFSGAPDGGVMCGLSLRVNDEWITKYDAAENTAIDAVKGGISDSMKRCAVQWGIGRILYKLKEGFATICDKNTPNALRGKTKEKETFYWLPPKLPDWAINKNGVNTPRSTTKHASEDSRPIPEHSKKSLANKVIDNKAKPEVLWATVHKVAEPSAEVRELRELDLETRLKEVRPHTFPNLMFFFRSEIGSERFKQEMDRLGYSKASDIDDKEVRLSVLAGLKKIALEG